MKTILSALVLLVSTSVFARQSIPLSPINFQISAAHALSKFDQVVQDPEGILKRFTPVGVKIRNKQVSQNEVSFTAIKTVLFVSKAVYVHGRLESREVSRGCYSLSMRFESSDPLVTNNVDELKASICVREDSESKISGQIKSQIITGDRYSRTLGPLAVNLIRDQVQPLLSALTAEIRSMR
ncbi:MAG: hypothetical protein V4598_06410 [Bdellovibrionota bacterium]